MRRASLGVKLLARYAQVIHGITNEQKNMRCFGYYFPFLVMMMMMVVMEYMYQLPRLVNFVPFNVVQRVLRPSVIISSLSHIQHHWTKLSGNVEMLSRLGVSYWHGYTCITWLNWILIKTRTFISSLFHHFVSLIYSCYVLEITGSTSCYTYTLPDMNYKLESFSFLLFNFPILLQKAGNFQKGPSEPNMNIIKYHRCPRC